MGRPRRMHRLRKRHSTPPPPLPPPQPSGDVVFQDRVTGETGVMRQRTDAIFEFHSDGHPPRPVREPGRYRRAGLTNEGDSASDSAAS